MSYLQMQADGLDLQHGTDAVPENTASATANADGSKPKQQKTPVDRLADRAGSRIPHHRQHRAESLGRRLSQPFAWLKRPGKVNRKHAANRSVLPAQRPRLQCCGVPVHLVIAFGMGIGLLAVLGVFLALPLYVYLDRLSHMQC